MKNILYILLLLSIFAMQACYQDLDDEPDFNYPEAGLEPTGEYEPLKLDLPFDGEPFDKSNYQFIPVLSEGVELNYGMGMKGLAARLSGESPYIVYKPYPSIKNSVVNELSNLDGWTVAFWMKAPKNDKTIGMFSIPETTQFWGNLEIFMEKKDENDFIHQNDAYFKLHLVSVRSTGRQEVWVEPIWFTDAFNKWIHAVFTYDGATSTFRDYHNSVQIYRQVFDNMDKLQFDNVGNIIIGTLQFQTVPSSTSGTGVQDWAGYYTGMLDQFYFYDRALSADEVNALYHSKD